MDFAIALALEQTEALSALRAVFGLSQLLAIHTVPPVVGDVCRHKAGQLAASSGQSVSSQVNFLIRTSIKDQVFHLAG